MHILLLPESNSLNTINHRTSLAVQQITNVVYESLLKAEIT